MLTRVAVKRGRTAVIACDNGTEFTSRARPLGLDAGVQLDFSRPGNATIESFNARRECLLQHYFSTLSEAPGRVSIFTC